MANHMGALSYENSPPDRPRAHCGRQQLVARRELEQPANYRNASPFGSWVMVVHQQLSFEGNEPQLKLPEGSMK